MRLTNKEPRVCREKCVRNEENARKLCRQNLVVKNLTVGCSAGKPLKICFVGILHDFAGSFAWCFSLHFRQAANMVFTTGSSVPQPTLISLIFTLSPSTFYALSNCGYADSIRTHISSIKLMVRPNRANRRGQRSDRGYAA